LEQKKLIQEFTNKGWGLWGLKKLMKKLREKLVHGKKMAQIILEMPSGSGLES